MSSFVELARRALNNKNARAAVASLLVINLQQKQKQKQKQKREHNENYEFHLQTQCDAVHSVPLLRPVCDRSESCDIRATSHQRQHTASNHPLHSSRLAEKHAKDLHQTYKVDWRTVLGEGAYGRVYPARHRSTGEKVALKKISKRYTNSSSFRSETDALLRIYDNGGHPNISGLRDMYCDDNHYYLVLDLVPGGEMFDHLIQYGSYSEDDASRLVQEILSALAFLHNIGVIHADLKPENILLCEKRQGSETVKIIDFGCAKIDKERGDYYLNSNKQSSDAAGLYSTDQPPSTGTKAYWAPECFRKDTPINEAVDLWAVGVIVYIMLVGVHPFDVKGIATDREIEQTIQSHPVPPMTPSLTSHLSPSAKDFIKLLMAPDPDKRLTALAALRHSWIRGERTPTEKIIGSDCKLAMYQDLRQKLATGIFAALVDESLKIEVSDDESEASSRTHILKRAFEVFDEKGKGYVNEADLSRVLTKVTGTSLSPEDQKDMITMARKESKRISTGLSLSDFSQLFSRLSHQHFPRGSYIYRAGDSGDAMYFINSGKVEITTKKGHLVSILRHGDFFGEGSLLEDRNHRFTSAKCATPVDVIKVSREDFNTYIASASGTKQSLKTKYKARTLLQAKQLIRLQTNLAKRSLKMGDVVFREGDMGDSMFLVDELIGGKLEVKRSGGENIHTLNPGDTFGESSLLFRRPRSSTVVCATKECHLHELPSSAFYEMLESDPTTKTALRAEAKQRTWE